MRFHRIYIELTNLCGLECSFCPTKNSPAQIVSVDFFNSIVAQSREYTREVACHVVGDPMILPNLEQYLDVLESHKMRALLTTSGHLIKKHTYKTLFHPAVKQINISLNSFNKSDTSLTYESYIEPILSLCQEKIKQKTEIFINLRLWNLDERLSERDYNERLFATLSREFGVDLDMDRVILQKSKTIRLDRKIVLHFDNYFEWPSLDNDYYGDGKCQGLDSHIGILASGKVVPCCLDCDGVIELGDLHQSSLKEILKSSRAVAMIEGFREGRAVEDLCRHCSYKNRFVVAKT